MGKLTDCNKLRQAKIREGNPDPASRVAQDHHPAVQGTIELGSHHLIVMNSM
jgi:hypothetical protein